MVATWVGTAVSRLKPERKKKKRTLPQNPEGPSKATMVLKENQNHATT